VTLWLLFPDSAHSMPTPRQGQNNLISGPRVHVKAWGTSTGPKGTQARLLASSAHSSQESSHLPGCQKPSSLEVMDVQHALIAIRAVISARKLIAASAPGSYGEAMARTTTTPRLRRTFEILIAGFSFCVERLAPFLVGLPSWSSVADTSVFLLSTTSLCK